MSFGERKIPAPRPTWGGVSKMEKKMVLEVQLRQVYGRDLIYPVNQTAKQCAELVGRKTLLEVDLKRLTALGFTIEWVPSSIPLGPE